jgi:hypothetical protein
MSCASLAHESLLNKDPTVWLDGASQTVGFFFRVINNKSEQAEHSPDDFNFFNCQIWPNFTKFMAGTTLFKECRKKFY